MGLGPARVCVGGAARESVFRSSVLAVSRIELPRPETYMPSRDESNRGSQRTQNSNPRRKRATKIRTEMAKARNVPESRGNARAGTSKVIALLLPCPLLPVPGGNLSKLYARGSQSVSGVPQYHFPGHALHEKGLQRQGVVALVSSQEQRALLVPLINR